jgi:uncharacterized protein (TIGR02646 family)
MKFIQKRKEPIAWKAYRDTEGVTFRAIDELQIALLEEQGYLCCYCLSRITQKTMKVEHWQARSKYPALILAYTNLLAH